MWQDMTMRIMPTRNESAHIQTHPTNSVQTPSNHIQPSVSMNEFSVNAWGSKFNYGVLSRVFIYLRLLQRMAYYWISETVLESKVVK